MRISVVPWAIVAVAFSAFGCDGEEGRNPPPPPPKAETKLLYDLTDPCKRLFPTPNDLFRADDLSDEGACAPTGDPIEMAIAEAMRNEGVPLDRKIRIPVSGGEVGVKEESLSSTAAFSLSGVAVGDPPPLVLLGRTTTSTGGTGFWEVIPVSGSIEGQDILLTPATPLESSHYYVAVVTNVVENDDGNALTPSKIATLLTKDDEITADSIEADANAVLKLERERLRLGDAIAALRGGSPPISSDRVVSIQGWSTSIGFGRLRQEVADYREAVRKGEFDFEVIDSQGDIPAAQYFPPGADPSFYEKIAFFREGVIRVPKVLDDENRLRFGWATTQVEMTDLPYRISVPAGTMGPASDYVIAILLPGFGRSRVDSAALGNAFGGTAPASAVLALDVPFHGERSVELEDTISNNGNENFAGSDGIPDRSGEGFFPGDPRALRDVQIAGVIEVLHVLETIQNRDAFPLAGIEPNGNLWHIIAQGHSAATAIYAGAFAENVSINATIQLPAGGVGIRNLVTEGPAKLRNAFLESAPEGVTEATLGAYFDRLEATVLEGISIAQAAAMAEEVFLLTAGAPRILLSHSAADEFVPESARQELIDHLNLPRDRVSRHLPACDDFFLYTCDFTRDSIPWLPEAQRQLATFASSRGNTVVSPAPP